MLSLSQLDQPATPSSARRNLRSTVKVVEVKGRNAWLVNGNDEEKEEEDEDSDDSDEESNGDGKTTAVNRGGLW